MPSGAFRLLPAASVATAVALAVLLAGCGATDTPTGRPTVTVYVDPPAGKATAARPAATPARTVRPQPSPSAVPTRLAVGPQRKGPHSYAEARARIEAASPAASVTDHFTSPSGNIVCNLGGAPLAMAACEVGKGRVDPPLASICPPDGPKDIGRIELDESGAFPVCNSDTIREGGEPRLAYGSRTASLDPVACLSEEFGVTCVDASTRHGFFIARGTFVTF